MAIEQYYLIYKLKKFIKLPALDIKINDYLYTHDSSKKYAY